LLLLLAASLLLLAFSCRAVLLLSQCSSMSRQRICASCDSSCPAFTSTARAAAARALMAGSGDSARQSKVGIEVSTGPKEVVVNIIDNGFGIPKESLPKIFYKFYRVSESRGEEETEGSGLGLALVKEIIEKHGGFVKVKSKLGVGSVFTFSLLKADMAMKPETGK
jgi:DNA topoisomerase VI subunit B